MSYLRLALPLALIWHGATWAQDASGPWQLTLSPVRAGSIFDVTEDPHVRAVVRNASGRGQTVHLDFEVVDFDGQVLNAGSIPVEVPEGQTRSVDVRVGEAAKLPHGEYLAARVVMVVDDKPQGEIQKGFGFLPKRTVATRPEETSCGLLAEGSWPLLQRLGVRYVRPNWAWNERPMEWANRYGIRYCPLVNEANAFVREQINEEEYADFVGQSVRRFKGYVTYWQLGNEFDVFHRDAPKSYVEAQRIGYAAAKAADPDCVVVGGSITELQVRREGWREALQFGLAKYCDVYDFHFYADLDTTQDLLDYIHATCEELGAEKPIWVTETTQVGMFDPDERNQAEYVFKRYSHLMANDVSVVFWHALRWPYPLDVDKVQATALVDHDGFARPGLFAYAAMAREFGGARFVRRWAIADGLYALEFSQDKRAKLVLWSRKASEQLRFRHPPGEVSAAYVNGRRRVWSSPDGILAVDVQQAPVIYDLPGSVMGVD